MPRYHITCEDGDQYEIIADHLTISGDWFQFAKGSHERGERMELVAIINGKKINNIQTVNNHTGEADKIMPI